MRLRRGFDFMLKDGQTFPENITVGISETALVDVQKLIEESNRYDGIDFPFTLEEFPYSLSELPVTLLYSVNHSVAGFLCIFNWSGIELYGLVHPAQRQRGIGQTLLDTAREIARQRGQKDLLLGFYGSMASAIAFAQANHATFSHAEYSMKLNLSMVGRTTSSYAELALRQIEADEIEQVASIAAQAFGEPEEEMREWLTRDVVKSLRRIFFIELQGNPIGTLRLVEAMDGRVDITLFSLLQPYRRRGYGRQILLSTVDMLLSEQRQHIALDVTTNNSAALALYQSCGFQEVRKDSYYKLVL